MNDLEFAWKQHDRELEKWKAQMSWQASIFSTHISALINLSTIAINSIILANSAAAGAVLALLGSIWSDPGRSAVMPIATKCISVFAGGVFVAMIAAGIGYLGQSCYAEGDQVLDNDVKRERWYKFGFAFRITAILSAVIGIASFGYGAWLGIAALEAVSKIVN